MFSSLSDYVKFLESKGELIRIKEFVDPVLEIAEVTDRVSKMPGGGKALLFENTGTRYPVLTNMMGSEKRILYTLGADSFEEIEQRFEDIINQILKEKSTLMDKLKMLPLLKEVSRWLPVNHKGSAPCQEVVQYNAKLSELPILKCWPQDGGRFITLPLVHTVSPVTGQRNVGMYRMQVFDDNTTGMHWHKHKTGAKHLSESGHRLPVAVCLGGDPLYTYCATAPLPEGIDEYLLAGFLRGKPVEMVECFTQKLKVPADCDFVIEGYVQKSEPLVLEGPFGDHTGFYSLEDYYPQFHVTCISHRKDAIYPATIVGVPPQEDRFIALATEKIFLTPIKLVISPEIKDLYLPEEGVGHNFAVVKIKKSYDGQAFKVANAMWGAGQMMFNKFLIVVDEEIDIRDHTLLKQCVCKHYFPESDTLVSKGPLDILDHTAPRVGFGGKLCIDATTKEYSRKEPVNMDQIIRVKFDKDEEESSEYRKLWLLGANCDAERDSSIKNGVLHLDATSKKGMKGFDREWPDIVTSSEETKAAVDAKWALISYGF